MIKKYLKKKWLEFCLYARVLAASLNPWAGDITPVGRLYLTKHSADGSVTEYGLVSTKVVTDAGVIYLRGILDGTNATGSVFKYHATGTGTTAESATQTALVTEVSSRVIGTQGAGGASNVYRTIGTVTYGGTFAITEHGVFSAASAGTLLDRSVFAAINVISGDSIQFTYDLTLPSGS